MTSHEARPWRVLAVDLLVAGVLAGALYAVLVLFPERILIGVTGPEIVLLEAGAIVLVAYLIARAVTNATGVFLARQGLTRRGHAVRLFINLIIAVGAVLALFKLAGVSAESIFIGAGFTGIVLGLASQTVLANVFAGLLIVFADPFRPGDRVGLVTSQYGMLPPSYPHEAVLPSHTGTVEDVGLTYTAVALDGGGLAKVPNSMVIQGMLILARGPSAHRVRMTFPRAVPLAAVEAAMPEVARAFPAEIQGRPPPRLEVTDLSETSWDAVVVVWSDARDPGTVRDRVIRTVLGHVPSPAAGAPPSVGPRP